MLTCPIPIRRLAGAALLLLGAAAAQAATYSFTGPAFTTFTSFTAPCAAAPCANFTAAMRVQGTFTTAAPLAANLTNQSILALVTGFSFSDGLTTYAHTDPLVTLMNAAITTDGAGNPVSMTFIPIRWRAAAPHAVNDRVDTLFVTPASSFAQANAQCAALSPPSGCAGLAADASTSRGEESAAVRPAVSLLAPAAAGVAAVPTLGGISLLILAVLVSAAALVMARRRNSF